MKKYPKTFHLPFSPGLQNDDRVQLDYSNFEGKRVIATIKMDGESCTMYNNHYHARSLDSRHHPSRDWIKAYHGSIKDNIPEGYRICGENLYAKHTIHYQNLKSYFYGFSMWKDDLCISWDDTIEWFELLNITPVSVIYDGIFDMNVLKKLYVSEYDGDQVEGFTVRLADAYHYDDFKESLVKYVVKNFVQTDVHWMHSEIIPNKLRS